MGGRTRTPSRTRFEWQRSFRVARSILISSASWAARAGRLSEPTEMLRALVLLAVMGAVSSAQKLDPVKWSLSVEPQAAAPGSKVLGRLTATIEPGWHLYSQSTPPPSRPTKIQLAEGSVFDGLK